MKVLVLTGPESSGKSWLAGEIQAHFGGVIVAEYVRHFIEQEQRDTCYDDIGTIARGQLRWEDRGRQERPELLILDTHLLSNILWSQTLFGQCPDWLEGELLKRNYDLHLLLSPVGIDWVDDGQRCQPDLHQRELFYRDCRAWLSSNDQTYVEVEGDWAQRKRQVLTIIESWLRSAEVRALVDATPLG